MPPQQNFLMMESYIETFKTNSQCLSLTPLVLYLLARLEPTPDETPIEFLYRICHGLGSQILD